MLGASMVQVHISDVVGSLPNMQALSVVPAEIIKMLALVVAIFQRRKPYKMVNSTE